MRLISCAFALALTASTASANDEIAPEVCDVTAGIVADAQVMRVDGDNERRATRKLARQYSDLGENYTGQVIPLLINYVYIQPESALDQDLAAFWKETCLTTDLSSVLPTE